VREGDKTKMKTEKKRERKKSYLVLYENEYLDRGRKAYTEDYLEEIGEGMPKKGIYLPDCEIDFDEIYVEKGDIYASFNLYPEQGITGVSKTEIGYMSIKIPIEMDVVVPIIEYYQKQVNKLKTIIEASKEVD
jgi:hypothetical protein